MTHYTLPGPTKSSSLPRIFSLLVWQVYERLAGVTVSAPLDATDAGPVTSSAASASQGTPDALASRTAGQAVGQPVAGLAAAGSERFSGQPVEAVLASLPAVWKRGMGDVEEGEVADGTVTVVLDDDPTGTQTVHDVTVLTTW